MKSKEGNAMKEKQIHVEISARHVHLTEDVYKKIFGEDAEMTSIKELSGGGAFVDARRVTIVGPKSEMKRVAVLGPYRPVQIELAKTDARKLGIDAPIRISGDTAGSAPIKIIGDCGEYLAEEGVIIAKRHIHIGQSDADEWRLGDFPHWCQVTRVAENLLRVHCTPNEPINLTREASVNVTTGKQTLGINVSQEARPFVAMIPNIGIGGRVVSLGFQAGYVAPMISASAGGNFMGSIVNYGLGNNTEEASYSTQGGFTVGLFADIRLYKNFYLKAGVEYLQYKYKNEFAGDVERIVPHQINTYQKGITQNRYTEDYSMSFIDIPILASYRIPVTKISHVQIHIGPVISCGLSAKMKLSGNTDANNMHMYKIVNKQMTDQRANMYNYTWETMGSGEMNLYDKSVDYTETYSDAILSNGDILKNSSFDASPLKRFNLAARIGVAYEYAGISIGVEYNLMFTNMANKKYWESERWKIFDKGADVLMSGYKQRNHYLSVKLGYTFRY